MGTIQLEDKSWVFESYKNAIPASNINFAPLHEVVGQMYSTAISNAEGMEKQLAECEVARHAAEKKRKEEEAKAARAKNAKGKKGADEPGSALPDSPVKGAKKGPP